MEIQKNLPEIQFLKTILLSNFKRPSFPFKFSYAVTYRCNLKCQMCNIWKKPPSDQEMNLEQINNFFKRSDAFSWIGITGGEPFLRKDLPEIVDIILHYCKNLSTIHFATNGQQVDLIIRQAERIRKKNENLRIVCTVSVDGPPETHDSIRGIPGTWQRAIETFKQLKKMDNVKAQIGHTISSGNLGQFKETFQSVQKEFPSFNFDDINVNVFHKSNFYYENLNTVPPDPRKLREAIYDILRMDSDPISINNFLRRTYLSLYLEYQESKKCPLKCQALSATCFLDPCGNLFPCVVYPKRLVNIKDVTEDFRALWNSPEAKQLSYECSHHLCPSCWSPCDAFSAIAGSLGKAVFSRIRIASRFS